MKGKEKLYFLLDVIEDVGVITPSGRPLIIDPTNDLNRRYGAIELLQLFIKLERDEQVLKVVKVPARVKDVDVIEDLDPYPHTDDGCWHVNLLPTFDKYFRIIQSEAAYQEFTGKKITPEAETQRLFYKIAEMDEQIKIRRNAFAKAQLTINSNPFILKQHELVTMQNLSNKHK